MKEKLITSELSASKYQNLDSLLKNNELEDNGAKDDHDMPQQALMDEDGNHQHKQEQTKIGKEKIKLTSKEDKYKFPKLV